MKILIVGGGIGGPALASFLDSDPRFDVTLVEQAPEFKTIGFGISLWPNGQKIIDMLGLKQLIEEKGYELPWWGLEDEKGHYLNEVFFSIFSKFGSTITIPRSTLHGAIVDKLKKGNTKIRLGTKLLSYKETEGKVLVEFDNGSKDEYDLIVGADGARSKVKESAFGKDYIRLYGWSAWIFWAKNAEEYSKGIVEIPTGNGGGCFIFPTAEKSFVMIVTKSPSRPLTPEESLTMLKEVVKRYQTSIQRMVNALDAKDVFYDELRYVDMPYWYKGRAILIGDAKHAVSPVTGMGASMALEDAYVLADELKKNFSDLRPERIFQKFVNRRRVRIKKFRKICHRSQSWFMASGIKLWLRNNFVRFFPMSYFTRPIDKFLSLEL